MVDIPDSFYRKAYRAIIAGACKSDPIAPIVYAAFVKKVEQNPENYQEADAALDDDNKISGFFDEVRREKTKEQLEEVQWLIINLQEYQKKWVDENFRQMTQLTDKHDKACWDFLHLHDARRFQITGHTGLDSTVRRLPQDNGHPADFKFGSRTKDKIGTSGACD